ncbi:hypothetical protein Tco_0679085 [Tanacetum coccineum]|uniref:Uncharacterized protein n=1 Tax=Tanacetum coccineum TaxID=301880 RepID=A0ABQ4XH13_9ASTR
MVLNSPCFTVKSWLVQDQTVPGKDKSNLLIADSLLKTIWFSIHLVVYNEELAIPEQTATGKGTSNLLMAGSWDMEKRDVVCSLEKVMMMEQNTTAEDDNDEGVAKNMITQKDGGVLIEGARTQDQHPTIPISKGASKKSSMEISYNKTIVRIAKEGSSHNEHLGVIYSDYSRPHTRPSSHN